MVYLTVKESAELENVGERAIQKRINQKKLFFREIKSNTGRGGKTYEVALTSLSEEAQKRYWDAQTESIDKQIIPASDAALSDEKTLQQELKEEAQVRRAMHCPNGMSKVNWITQIAAEMGCSPRTLQRKIEKLKIYGTLHTARRRRADRGSVRSWDGGAEDIFRALALRPENRHATIKALYNQTCLKAAEYGLIVGSERTAYRIYDDMGIAAHTFRKKGWRGIEVEVLPPILRDYNDLQVNDIWVGDQHTFNFFVVNEFSGAVVRLQGYVWQDLRSRAIMGVSLAQQYDSWSIGLALRDGIMSKMERIPYGKPKCVYNDWGKPERARYLSKLAAVKIDARGVDDDFEQFISPFTTDETGVYDELNIQTRSAIVRNSKAKLIERTFGVLEQNLLDMGLKGYAGNRAGSLTDADKDDLKRWKARGELMTAREFAEVVKKVCAEYNARPHRGYGMLGLSPNDVFEAAVAKGYKPIVIDKKQADLIFMKSAKRRVAPAGVQIDGDWYHDMDKMVALVKQQVEVRWEPFGGEVHIFHNGEYVCAAAAYQRGSMADDALTAEMNEKKKRLGKNIKKELAALTIADEDYNNQHDEAKVRKAVTRFDGVTRKEERAKTPKKSKKQVDVWEILAETNRSLVFDRN